MSSAICLNLDQSTILSSGNGLNKNFNGLQTVTFRITFLLLQLLLRLMMMMMMMMMMIEIGLGKGETEAD